MRIENDFYLVEVDQETGALLRISDKRGALDLITEKRLAASFRLLLPLPHLRSNYLDGSEQRVSEINGTDEGIDIRYAGPLLGSEGTYEISVLLRIAFGDGALVFSCELTNQSPYAVTEVWYPMIGGMTGLGEGEDGRSARALVPYHYTQQDMAIFRRFDGVKLGIPNAEKVFTYPARMSMPWMSFYHPEKQRALYFAAQDREIRSKAFRLQLDPGTARGRSGSDWPTPEEAGDTPIGMTAEWIFFPHTGQGGTFESPPVVLEAHAGDWRESARIYREWFQASFGVVDSSQHWLRHEPAAMDTMFMFAEDNLNLIFKDIPEWAASAASRGVTTVLISGWDVGGHDRGFPDYSVEPRLGTWQELAAGVEACHELGLRVMFFANLQWADGSTEWFNSELHRYAFKDPYGVDAEVIGGWGMGTVSARIGGTRVPMIPINPSHPEVRELFVRQMRRLVELGADGLHIDKLTYPTLDFDFNPRLGISPDKAYWGGVLESVREMVEVCREVNPQFCFSYEGPWDRLMSFSDVTWWAHGHSVLREVFPSRVAYRGVTQPWSFNDVNQALLYAENLLIGPANYSAGMDYPPMQALSDYIAEVVKIRRKLDSALACEELVDASEPLFRAREPELALCGEFVASEHAKWSVYRNARTRRRAVVLVNFGRSKLGIDAFHFIGASCGRSMILEPFRAAREVSLPAELTVPPETAVFVVEHDTSGESGESAARDAHQR